MKEVAALSFRILLTAAARLGISAEDALMHVASKQDLLCGARNRYPWSDYVALIEQIATLCGGHEQFARAGEMLPDLAPEGAALFGTFVSPVALYQFIHNVVDPLLFPMVTSSCTTEPDGRLLTSFSIQEPYAPSLAFGWGSIGGERTVPRHIGLEHAKVEVMLLTDREMVALVTPPPSRTVLARARGSLPAFARAVLSEIGGNDEVQLTHSALEATLTEMRTQNETLASEMRLREQTERALGQALASVSAAAFIVSGETVEGVNALGKTALDREGPALASAIREVVLQPAKATDFEVTSLGPSSFFVLRRGVNHEIERRIARAAERWSLTARQCDVVRGLVEGRSNQQLAEQLGCTTRTVETHVTALLERADASSRLAIVASFWSDL